MRDSIGSASQAVVVRIEQPMAVDVWVLHDRPGRGDKQLPQPDADPVGRRRIGDVSGLVADAPGRIFGAGFCQAAGQNQLDGNVCLLTGPGHG